jgi:hypothetical protein
VGRHAKVIEVAEFEITLVEPDMVKPLRVQRRPPVAELMSIVS